MYSCTPYGKTKIIFTEYGKGTVPLHPKCNSFFEVYQYTKPTIKRCSLWSDGPR